MNHTSDYITESDKIMKSSFVLSLVIALAICFTTDPTPTMAEDFNPSIEKQGIRDSRPASGDVHLLVNSCYRMRK